MSRRAPRSHSPDDRRRRFEESYAANRDQIFGYVLRRTDDREDAADVLAEVFLTAWRRIDDVPPGDQARLWLYGVARRTLANHRRGRRRRDALVTGLAAGLRDEAATQEAALPDADGDLATIREVLRGLPERDRDVLMLRCWERLDHEQIAEVLGCSAGSARVRLHRARHRFADELHRRGIAPGGATARYAARTARQTRGELV